MIDVKQTIFETVKDKINKMRFLGENNPKKLKLLLYLIVVDDIYDWGSYIGESQVVLDLLKEIRTNLILCNPDFKIQRFPITGYYSTNTPQTSIQYADISESVTEITESITPEPSENPWTPDLSCTPKIVLFGGSQDIYKAREDGTPAIDFATLTNCEKMDLYINRETGQAYYYDEQGISQMIKTENAQIAWENVTDKPTIYSGITHEVKPEDKVLNVSLLEEGEQSSNVSVADNDDLNSIL